MSEAPAPTGAPEEDEVVKASANEPRESVDEEVDAVEPTSDSTSTGAKGPSTATTEPSSSTATKPESQSSPAPEATTGGASSSLSSKAESADAAPTNTAEEATEPSPAANGEALTNTTGTVTKEQKTEQEENKEEEKKKQETEKEETKKEEQEKKKETQEGEVTDDRTTKEEETKEKKEEEEEEEKPEQGAKKVGPAAVESTAHAPATPEASSVAKDKMNGVASAEASSVPKDKENGAAAAAASPEKTEKKEEKEKGKKMPSLAQLKAAPSNGSTKRPRRPSVASGTKDDGDAGTGGSGDDEEPVSMAGMDDDDDDDDDEEEMELIARAAADGSALGQTEEYSEVESDPVVWLPHEEDKDQRIKRHIPLSHVEVDDVGVYFRWHGYRVFCMADVYKDENELRPCLTVAGEARCPWWPLGASVVIKHMRWNPDRDYFEVKAGKSPWKPACMLCAQGVFGGELDTPRPAQFGFGTVKTHCNTCRPPRMGVVALAKCKVCFKATPSYSWPNKGNKTHCSKCRKPGMVMSASRVCKHERCKNLARFGFDGRRDFCEEHKKAGMEKGYRKCMRCKVAAATVGRHKYFTHCDACMEELRAGVKTTDSARSASGTKRKRRRKKESAAGSDAGSVTSTKAKGKAKAKKTTKGGGGRKRRASEGASDAGDGDGDGGGGGGNGSSKSATKATAAPKRRKKAARKPAAAATADAAASPSGGGGATAGPAGAGGEGVTPEQLAAVRAIMQSGVPSPVSAGEQLRRLTEAQERASPTKDGQARQQAAAQVAATQRQMIQQQHEAASAEALQEGLLKELREAQMMKMQIGQHYEIYQTLLLREANGATDPELKKNLLLQAQQLPASLLEQLRIAQAREEFAQSTLHELHRRKTVEQQEQIMLLMERLRANPAALQPQ